jgi:hypothetical protein
VIVLRLLSLLAGTVVVWIVVSSAIRTVIVPRGEVVVVLTRAVFRRILHTRSARGRTTA